MDQVHTIKLNGKEYPFAYSPSVMTRAHAMPGAKESELVLQYSIIYQAIKKGCKREGVKFPFPPGEEGVDFITELCFDDKANGGDGMKRMLEIIEEASIKYTDEEIDSKKNSQGMKSNGTSSNIAESPNTLNANPEPLTTIFTPGEIVT